MDVLKNIASDKKFKNTLYLDPLEPINDGIVFLYAEWSQSIVVYKKLLDSLAKFHDLPLTVFNIDNIPFRKWAASLNLKSNGYGEIFWLKNGVVVYNLENKGLLSEFPELTNKEFATILENLEQKLVLMHEGYQFPPLSPNSSSSE